jgi:hypothetical protein
MPDNHRSPRIGKLDTISDVRRELARNYRRAARDPLNIDYHKSLCHILKLLADVLGVETLEARLDALEKGAADLPKPGSIGMRGLRSITGGKG